MRRVGLLIVTTCLLFAIALSGHAEGVDSSDSSEYLIKAGFIFNFAKFVEWPATAFAQPDSPIVIGIFGMDPLGTIINQIVQDKKIGARGFVVKRLKWGSDIKEPRDCKIL